MSALYDSSLRLRAALLSLGMLLNGVIWNTAFAQCEPEVASSPGDVTIAYDPFRPTNATERIELVLNNPTEEPCSLELVITSLQGEPINGLTLGEGLQLRFRNSDIPHSETAIRPGVYPVTLPASSRTSVGLDLVVVQDAVLAPGRYDTTVRLDFRRLNETAPAMDPFELTVSVTSEARAQVNLAGAAGSFGASGSSVETVDFGPMETGATRRVYLQLRSNGPARLTFTSENKGYLRRLPQEDTMPSAPYTLSVEGAPLDLSAPAAIDVEPPRTIDGVSQALDLTLGDVSALPAGEFRDFIYIDVDPLLSGG